MVRIQYYPKQMTRDAEDKLNFNKWKIWMYSYHYFYCCYYYYYFYCHCYDYYRQLLLTIIITTAMSMIMIMVMIRRIVDDEDSNVVAASCGRSISNSIEVRNASWLRAKMRQSSSNKTGWLTPTSHMQKTERDEERTGNKILETNCLERWGVKSWNTALGYALNTSFPN